MTETDTLTLKIIGCAIEVHRQLGPGLMESVHEKAPCLELAQAGLTFKRQLGLPLVYKGPTLGEYRLDLLVEDSVVVEIRSVARFEPVFQAQLLGYLRITGKSIGLLINFNSAVLRDGLRRFII